MVKRFLESLLNGAGEEVLVVRTKQISGACTILCQNGAPRLLLVLNKLDLQSHFIAMVPKVPGDGPETLDDGN